MTLEDLKQIFFKDKAIKEDSQFYEWAVAKREINTLKNFPRAKRRQVWWCIIGKNIGQEQSCTKGFERPVLVLKVFGNIFWGIPITSSDPEGKKEQNPLYHKVDNITYTNNAGELKSLQGFVALHQLRVFDSRRLKRKMLKIGEIPFEQILRKVRGLL